MDEDDDFQPDFGIEYLKEMGTKEQKAVVKQMQGFGWRATHLFEYQIGWLGVWMIVRPTQTTGSHLPAYLHAYVKPDGSVKRWKP